jgi:hypothetical protein
MECQHELPEAVQSAVSEYAQLELGTDQSKYVKLPKSDLLKLEIGRWIETRKHDLGGEMRDMVTLHLLIGIDHSTQENLRIMANNAVAAERVQAENELVTERLKGAGVVLGGVLGFLALVWGGLSLLGPRQCATSEVNVAAPPAAAVARKGAAFYAIAFAVAFAIFIVIATLLLYLLA